jgi:hypothetical protein
MHVDTPKLLIAKLAEQVLCQRLGIVAEGEQVTEAAIAKIVQMFNGQLPGITIAALHALFRMKCDFVEAVAVDQDADTATDAGSQT